jgi:hypothetical protein
MSVTLQEEAAGKLPIIRLSGKLTTATIRYFPEEKADEAFDWIREGVLQPV